MTPFLPRIVHNLYRVYILHSPQEFVIGFSLVIEKLLLVPILFYLVMGNCWKLK